MTCNTLAQLITETLMGVGMPRKEICEIEDAARAVTHSLALLNQHTTFSAQNLDLRSYEWEPQTRDEVLSGASDVAVPAWIERRRNINSDESDDTWAYVPTCELAVLESARERNLARCAFYIKDGQMHVKFSYNPRDYAFPTHRLWYSANVNIAASLNDTALDTQATGLSANFFPMVSGMAELELISTMRIKQAMEKPNPDLVEAWGKRETYLTGKVSAWKDRFMHFTYGERVRRGRRRQNVLGRWQ